MNTLPRESLQLSSLISDGAFVVSSPNTPASMSRSHLTSPRFPSPSILPPSDSIDFGRHSLNATHVRSFRESTPLSVTSPNRCLFLPSLYRNDQGSAHTDNKLILTAAEYEVPTPNTTFSVGDRTLDTDNPTYDHITQADDTDRTCATASSGSVHQLPTGMLTELVECKHDSLEETPSVKELNFNNPNSPIPHHKSCDSPQELPTATLSSDETLTQEGHPTLEYITTEGTQVSQKNDGSIKPQDTSCLSTPIPVVVVSCDNEDSKVVADLSN